VAYALLDEKNHRLWTTLKVTDNQYSRLS